MAESPKTKQSHRKSKKVPKKPPNDSDESSETTPKLSEVEKSKRSHQSQSSSDDESPKKKTKMTPNGKVTSLSGAAWSYEEEVALMEKVDEHLTQKESEGDSKKSLFLKSIDWDHIHCDSHTTQEAHARFQVISNRVRKLRTAREILDDMKIAINRKGNPTLKKKDIDPDMPKKPLSSYFQFIQAKRQGVLERHPNLKNIELSQKLGSKWKKLSEEKRKKYSDRFHQGMEVYNQELMEYLISHNPEIDPPKTAFDLWAEDETKKIRKDRPEISEKKLSKKIKRRWENVEEDERKKWEKLEKKLQRSFREKIRKAKQKKDDSPAE